jgi:hypothetical protein
LNLALNLVLIPRWSWQGAAAASLITDGALAVSNGLLVAWLLRRPAPSLSSGSSLPETRPPAEVPVPSPTDDRGPRSFDRPVNFAAMEGTPPANKPAGPSLRPG